MHPAPGLTTTYYVKTVDTDGQFVREVVVRSISARDALRQAAVELDACESIDLRDPLCITSLARS